MYYYLIYVSHFLYSVWEDFLSVAMTADKYHNIWFVFRFGVLAAIESAYV